MDTGVTEDNTMEKLLCLKFGLVIALTIVTRVSIADDNKIYIDQVGSSATINLTQDGSNNVIAGSADGTTAMTIDGNNSTVTIDTVGDSNKVVGNLVGTTTTTINIDGSSNELNVDVDPEDIHGGSDSTISIDLDGDSANIDLNVAENDLATGLNLDWTLLGDYIDISFDVDSTDVDSTLDIDGDSVNINYDADGYAGHTSSVTGVGSYVDITIDQQSTLQADNVTVEYDGSGSANTPSTICISQSDSGTATGC